MFTISNPFTLSKARRGRQTAKSIDGGVPITIRGPVYAASIGLLAAYVNGYANAGLGALAWALIGVTAAAELLKPALGELAAEAIEAKDRGAGRIVGLAAAVCVLIGMGGGLVAMNVADAPRQARSAASRVSVMADAAVTAAQARVDAVPTCTPEMPAARCERMTMQNEAVLSERRVALATAKQSAGDAAAALAALPTAGPGLPEGVTLWHKALFVAGAEFLMFGVPFATLRLRRRSGQPKVTVPAPVAAETPKPVKVNSGGWEARREKYGPSGRKAATRVGLRLVNA